MQLPIAVAVAVTTSLVALFIIGFFIFRCLKKPTARDNKTQEPQNTCLHFSIEEIRTATKNFNDSLIIGNGGFGNVYKGNIERCHVPVAIKRLRPGSDQGAHEFRTEIEMLSRFRHPHLVSLIGYCNEGGEMILVYDFMARGTLRDHLYGSESSLSWNRRLEICLGAARGIQFLHAGVNDDKRMVIHRDVKSTNILLDETINNGKHPTTSSTLTFYTPHHLLSLPPNHSTLHSTFTSPIVFSFNTLPHHILYPTTFYFIFLFKFLYLFFMIK
ncbi:hypothetical protein P8452_33677 [Trifolium repens]|nr:hypothetical protein P8452_33677 [Trifolium repens]